MAGVKMGIGTSGMFNIYIGEAAPVFKSLCASKVVLLQGVSGKSFKESRTTFLAPEYFEANVPGLDIDEEATFIF